MSPYTAEEAEWLSMHAGSSYWLLSHADVEAPVPANDNDGTPPSDRHSAG
ncbi:MAG TPA: hypothetical protein VLV76_01630 [Candidatus Acidoferrum sp.]|nr:hypothetical protein [Candidatus Acidoferrum sp.]